MSNKQTITERVVPFKIAALLKAKGFDWKINNFYHYATSIKGITTGGYLNKYRSNVAYTNTEWANTAKEFKEAIWKGLDAKHPNISAPTYDMVVDWLLEKGYYLNVVLVGENKFVFKIIDIPKQVTFIGTPSSDIHDRYDAFDKGILAILKKL